MSTTQKPASISDFFPTDPRSLRQWSREILERAFADRARKPDALYDERKGKTMPFFARIIADYRAWISRGARTDTLIEGHELVGLAIEDMAEDRSSIPGRLHLTREEAYATEFDVEAEVNPIQRRAAMPNASLTDKELALMASLRELRTLKQYIRSLKREIENRKSLERHVGHRPIGAA